MKKTLKTELISLAHKILQLKDTTSYEALASDAQQLYEKLALLAYAEKLEKGVTPTLKVGEIEEQLSKTVSEEDTELDRSEQDQVETDIGETSIDISDTHRPDGTAYNTDEPLHEPVIEKIKDMVAQMPAETAAVDELIDAINPQDSYQKNDMLDIGGEFAQMPVFERVETIVEDDKPKNLNDKLKTGLKIGLNDRLAFIKHLFDGSDVDYNRVLSQLETFNSLEEAQQFIEQMVKPDYSNWEGKEVYEERFTQLLERKFD